MRNLSRTVEVNETHHDDRGVDRTQIRCTFRSQSVWVIEARSPLKKTWTRRIYVFVYCYCVIYYCWNGVDGPRSHVLHLEFSFPACPYRLHSSVHAIPTIVKPFWALLLCYGIVKNAVIHALYYVTIERPRGVASRCKRRSDQKYVVRSSNSPTTGPRKNLRKCDPRFPCRSL